MKYATIVKLAEETGLPIETLVECPLNLLQDLAIAATKVHNARCELHQKVILCKAYTPEAVK